MGIAKQFYWTIFIQCWLLVSCEAETNDSGYGVLYAEVPGTSLSATFCITYDPGFHELPQLRQDAELLPLKDLTSPSYEFLCRSSAELPPINGAAVATTRGNCTFSEKARLAQTHGSQALVVVSSELTHLTANSSSDYSDINITVAMIARESFIKIQELGSTVHVKLYSPPFSARADFNLCVIWLLAVMTVTIGSFWSGRIKYHLWLNKMSALPGSRHHSSADVEFTPVFVLVTVVMMCGMLLGLYFFFNYLVYVVIALFVLAASLALHDCLVTIFHLLPFPDCVRCRLPSNRLPLLQHRPFIVNILLFFVSVGVGVLWFLIRHTAYAWVLQDFLGILFCIQMMKVIRLPNLKTCVILLSLLFIYDIFFVFITPLFTKSGRSIMIDVATGGGGSGGEMLPMVLIVPRILTSDSSICMLPYSLLGFGDILVPGLLVSFCYGFDLQVKSRNVYFISTVIAYGLGLVLTFLALIIMHGGQPALLYLVPCTLLTTVVIGAIRKELRQLWTGFPNHLATSPIASDDAASSSARASIDKESYRVHVDNVAVKHSTAEEQEHLINK